METRSHSNQSNSGAEKGDIMDLKNINKSETMHLSLKAEYCPTWTAKDAFRELIQNW